MLLPASSEFISLCRSQVALLTQGLGASASVVYLAQEWVEGLEAKLVPVVAYPETAAWEEFPGLMRSLPSHEEPPASKQRNRQALESEISLFTRDSLSQFEHDPKIEQWTLSDLEDSTLYSPAISPETGEPFEASEQVILPLVHEGVVMGLLVTSREDRPWNEQERSQVERVAQTLTLACTLDQRSQWLEQERQQQHLLQTQQHDRLDDLLHQIRNPLTALRTFGKLLLKRLRAPDPNRDVATSIVRESDRLQSLLQQFSQTLEGTESAAWASTPSLTAQPTYPLLPGANVPERPLLPSIPAAFSSDSDFTDCQLQEALSPLLMSAQAIAQERGLQILAQVPPDLPRVRVQAPALVEVLNNLIDNALKYTPAPGLVQIHAWVDRDRQQVGLAISDTGPGIPESDLPHIFERHYRGVQAQTEIPGTGLGLAIARELLLPMQGDIQVVSPALSPLPAHSAPQTLPHTFGLGTTFLVWLPLAQS